MSRATCRAPSALLIFTAFVERAAHIYYSNLLLVFATRILLLVFCYSYLSLVFATGRVHIAVRAHGKVLKVMELHELGGQAQKILL
jgi:hypothetical protein